jgi:hypothetical protein
VTRPSAPPPRPPGTLTVLRVWLWGSGIALTSFLIWTIAPVLFLVLALALALGLISASMVKLARLLEAWKNGPADASRDRE